jgi:hypothetical protein
VRHVAERFPSVWSKPREKYLVTGRLGLLECAGKRTLSEIVSTVPQPPGVRGVSRFLAVAAWVQEAVVVNWLERVRPEMQPLVEAEREQQRQAQAKRRGRPNDPCVTG